MPEFIPSHTPSDVDEFTRGYLAAVEWLLDEDVNRDKIRGFSRDAIARAKGDCKAFQRDNAADLAAYEESTGRDMECAGHDFWLTRNHHGAGFWDRGDHPCLRRLTDAAHVYGERYNAVYRGRIQID